MPCPANVVPHWNNSLHAADIVIIVLYFVVVLAFGLWVSLIALSTYLLLSYSVKEFTIT